MAGASGEGHLNALARNGYIEILHDTERGLREINPGEVPIVDTIEECPHGQPLLDEKHIVGDWSSCFTDYRAGQAREGMRREAVGRCP